MKKNLLFGLMLMLAWSCNTTPSKKNADYVDPFIGTDFHGHTFPGATVPQGGVQLSPNTRRNNWDACSGYHYSDSTIFGFSHLHLSGTGAIDLGDILFHPTTKEVNLKNEGYIFEPLKFKHQDEVAKAGYYAVQFRDPEIFAELTATAHTGIHRYTFPASATSKIIVDLHHSLSDETIHHTQLNVTADNEITGARLTSGWTPNQHIYFVAQFSKPFNALNLVSNGTKNDSMSLSGDNIQAVAYFQTADKEQIEVKVGLSVVSIENARLNLKRETEGKNFDDLKMEAFQLWDEALSVIQIEEGGDNEKEIFYTALYHSLIMPDLMSDVDGSYRQHNMEIAKAPEGRKMYSTLSLWDTYRTWHPLMTLVNDQLVEDMIHSLLAMYDATGELPIWPLVSGETGTMIGYHSVSVIADAYLKGLRGFDAEHAFEAMKASSNSHRKGGKYYVENGFIPADRHKESVSCLLEYAYDDWCIARMAAEMGKQEEALLYKKRAMSWMNVFDGNTKFFRGKRSDGNWITPFNPFEVSRDYTEANAWQYRFFVPHDVNGLVSMFGSKEEFIAAFDGLYDETTKVISDIPDVTGLIGQYAHGNEPSHHMAYVYSFVGQPWKTQAMVRRVLNEMYSTEPDGISGNEDCGQMSAWYIMSSMGFYPVAPGSNEYVFSAPIFGKVNLRLHNGNQLLIVANQPEKNSYITKVLFNGSEIKENYITHERLMQGGKLEFILSENPDFERGVHPATRPYSMSNSPLVSVPYIVQDVHLFENEVIVEMGCATQGAAIHFTLDGSEPDEQSPLYTGAIKITDDAIIKAKAFKEGFLPSALFSIAAQKAVFQKPDRATANKNGVAFRYYQGNFSSVYDLLKTKAVFVGVVDVPSLELARDEDDFGFIFEGLISIPDDGIYEFFTESDDGSVLEIGGKAIVLNDGSHGNIKASGRIPLLKGYHSYRLLYFEDYEGQDLDWGMRKMNEEDFSPIDANQLFLK